MSTGLVAAPLLLAAICGTWGGLLWWHEHHWQRFTAWMFALAAWFATLAIPAFQYALASLLQTSGGATVVIVLVLISFATFYLTAVRTDRESWLRRKVLRRESRKDSGKGQPAKEVVPYISSRSPQRPDRHHRIWTPFWSVMTGVLGVVVFGGWRLLAEDIGKSAAISGRQLIESSRQINSGHAAAAVPAGSRPGIYIAGIAVLLVLVIVMHRIDKRREKARKEAAATGGGKGGRGAPQIMGGGAW